MPAPVIIEDYEPRWAVLFVEEKARILEVAAPGSWLSSTFGSTVVPGLSAKLIVDILAGVRRLDAALNCVDSPAEIGSQYRSMRRKFPTAGTSAKGLRMARRTFHMLERGGDLWTRPCCSVTTPGHPRRRPGDPGSSRGKSRLASWTIARPTRTRRRTPFGSLKRGRKPDYQEGPERVVCLHFRRLPQLTTLG